jgi:hypothetical protein
LSVEASGPSFISAEIDAIPFLGLAGEGPGNPLAFCVASRASADSLRGAADGLAARLAASQAGGHSCTAAASAAASRAVLVLADVLKRSDEISGDLSGYADQSPARGATCVQAYDALAR